MGSNLLEDETMHEIDQFVVSHYNIAVSILIVIGGFLKLVWQSKSNGDKLDVLLIKHDNMSATQQTMQLEVREQSMQMNAIAKDMGEIKIDTRSHEKEISSLRAEIAGVKSQLKAS